MAVCWVSERNHWILVNDYHEKEDLSLLSPTPSFGDDDIPRRQDCARPSGSAEIHKLGGLPLLIRTCRPTDPKP